MICMKTSWIRDRWWESDEEKRESGADRRPAYR
jgi:hypothetical protein